MIKRQRKAILLSSPACLVVLTCTAQRMAGMHALVMNLTADSQSLQQNRGSGRGAGHAVRAQRQVADGRSADAV